MFEGCSFRIAANYSAQDRKSI